MCNVSATAAASLHVTSIMKLTYIYMPKKPHVYSTWIIDLNVKLNTIKLLKQHI